jgi:hypothetical protein
MANPPAPALDLLQLEQEGIEVNEWDNGSQDWKPPLNSVRLATTRRQELFCTHCAKHLTSWDVQDHINRDRHINKKSWTTAPTASSSAATTVAPIDFPQPPKRIKLKSNNHRSRTPIARKIDLMGTTSSKAPPSTRPLTVLRNVPIQFLAASDADPTFAALEQTLQNDLANMTFENAESVGMTTSLQIVPKLQAASGICHRYRRCPCLLLFRRCHCRCLR